MLEDNSLEDTDLKDMIAGEDYELHNWNRNPTPGEIEQCAPHIDEIIQVYKPDGIVYLGEIAKSYRHTLPTLSLYHPAYIARMEYKLITVKKQAKQLNDFIEGFIESHLEG
jgi:uracil-DNA glycosylase